MRAVVASLISMFLPTLLLASEDSRRAQVAAATADALGALERDVLAASVTPGVSVEQFLQKTRSRDAFDKTLRQAEQIGGPRWLDDKTCQVRLELPGGDVAEALVAIAQDHPGEAGLPADVLRDRLDRSLRDTTFAATGISTCASERLRPPPGQVAWRGVPEAAVKAAVKDARGDAARRVLDDLRSADPRLDKAIADEKVRGDLEAWVMSRPVTSVDFRDDLEVRVAVATGGDAVWRQLLAAVGERKELDFPNDERAQGEIRNAVVRGVDATVTGRAVAKTNGGGAAVNPRATVAVPREPPGWVTDQVDARGSSRAVNGRLKTARAAERDARDKLRERIEALSLSRNLTLGDAARRDDRVRDAIDRAIDRARPRKVNYRSDGGAEVSFTLDLRDLWYDLEQ